MYFTTFQMHVKGVFNLLSFSPFVYVCLPNALFIWEAIYSKNTEYLLLGKDKQGRWVFTPPKNSRVFQKNIYFDFDLKTFPR